MIDVVHKPSGVWFVQIGIGLVELVNGDAWLTTKVLGFNLGKKIGPNRNGQKETIIMHTILSNKILKHIIHFNIVVS